MKSLLNILRECEAGFATPMATIGMGDVSVDNLEPITQKKKHKKKKKMKSLKKYLTVVNESMSKNDWNSRTWDINDFEKFLGIIKLNSQDIELFLNAHNTSEEITEYSLVVKNFDDYVFDNITTMKAFDDYDLSKLFSVIGINDRGNGMAFWYDMGNGIRTIALEIENTKSGDLHLFVFGCGEDTLEDIIDDIRRLGVKEIEKEVCLADKKREIL